MLHAKADLSEVVESSDHNHLIKKYFKEVRKFKKKMCGYGKDEAKYRKLLKGYRGDGFYVPLKADGKVNTQLIKSSMKLLREKQKWIAGIYLKLRKYKKLPALKERIAEIQNYIDLNLSYKYQYEVQELRTKNIVEGARESINQLIKSFSKLEKEIFYLKGFNYPVDHLIQRFNYESHLNKGETTKAREIFFKRKIYEDGAMNKKGKPDTFYRTALNTIKINLTKQRLFIAEDVRYDLEWLLLGNGIFDII